MRADIRAAVALDAVLGCPVGNQNSDAALLICGCAGRCRAVFIALECGNRKIIAFLSTDSGLNVVDEINDILAAFCSLLEVKSFIRAILPGFRNLYFMNLLGTS